MNTLTQTHIYPRSIVSNIQTTHDCTSFHYLPKMNDIEFIKLSKTSSELKKQKQCNKMQGRKAIGIKLSLKDSELIRCFVSVVEEEIDVVVFEDGIPLDVLAILPSDLVKTTQTKFIASIENKQEAFILVEHWQKKYHLLPDAFLISNIKGGKDLIKVSELYTNTAS